MFVLKFRMFGDFVLSSSAYALPYMTTRDLGQQPIVKSMSISTAEHVNGHTK